MQQQLHLFERIFDNPCLKAVMWQFNGQNFQRGLHAHVRVETGKQSRQTWFRSAATKI